MNNEIVITRKLSDMISDGENAQIILTDKEIQMIYRLRVKENILHEVNWYNYSQCDSKLTMEQMENITNEIMEKMDYNSDENTKIIEYTICDFLDSEDLYNEE